MIIRSLNGDDEINQTLNIAMRQTIRALIEAGDISKERGEEFIDEHICMIVAENGGFTDWIKSRFGKVRDNMTHIFVVKVTGLNIDKDE